MDNPGRLWKLRTVKSYWERALCMPSASVAPLSQIGANEAGAEIGTTAATMASCRSFAEFFARLSAHEQRIVFAPRGARIDRLIRNRQKPNALALNIASDQEGLRFNAPD